MDIGEKKKQNMIGIEKSIKSFLDFLVDWSRQRNVPESHTFAPYDYIHILERIKTEKNCGPSTFIRISISSDYSEDDLNTFRRDDEWNYTRGFAKINYWDEFDSMFEYEPNANGTPYGTFVHDFIVGVGVNEENDLLAREILKNIKSYADSVCQNENLEVNVFISDLIVKRSSGCYVATAVYGSYNCPEVWTLRRFRDKTLAETWYGRAFIRLYYAISPTLVKYFGKAKWFQRLFRKPLDGFVKKLNASGFEDTPYDDKIY